MSKLICIIASPFNPRVLALADKLAAKECLNGNIPIHPCRYSSEFTDEVVKQIKEKSEKSPWVTGILESIKLASIIYVVKDSESDDYPDPLVKFATLLRKEVVTYIENEYHEGGI